MSHQRRRTLLPLSLTVIALLLYGVFVVFAAPPGTGGYNPGETLNPECAPGDTVPEPCIVRLGISIGDNVRNGDNDSILYLDNSGNLTQDVNFTRDAITQATAIATPIPAGYSTNAGASFTVVADTAGGTGNAISLIFNGTDDVDTVVAAWNGANPSNTATVVSGGTSIPSAQTFTLLGGATTTFRTGSLLGGTVFGAGFESQDIENDIVTAQVSGNLLAFGLTHGNASLVQNDSLGDISASIQGIGQQSFLVGNLNTFDYFNQIRLDTDSINFESVVSGNEASLFISNGNDVGWRLANIDYHLPNGSLPNAGDVLTVSSTTGNNAYLAFQPAGGSSGWSLSGNTIVPGNFLGTLNAEDLIFKTDNNQTGFISSNGQSIGFGNQAGNNGSRNQTIYLGAAAGDGATNATGSTFIGYFSGKDAVESTGVVFIGSDAGSYADNADFGVFLGQNAGTGATDAQESNFIGVSAGDTASFANDSNFIGTYAGYHATYASFSSFLGPYAGYLSENATQSNFIGYQAGYNADDAAHSIFIGRSAGMNDVVDNTSTANDYSILIGNESSTGNFSNSIALGAYAVNTASNQLTVGSSTRLITSVFIGSSKGSASTDNTFFVGGDAGLNATNAAYANFFGSNAGKSAIGAIYSNFFGRDAGNGATGAFQSNFLGYNAGYLATSASQSNFFGIDAGAVATSAHNSNFFGAAAGQNAISAYHSNFFGSSAGKSATDAAQSNFLGQNAGYFADEASESNFFGSSAGSLAINASNSIFIGQEAGINDTVDNTGNANDFSILIGKSTSTGGWENSIAIGGSATNTASNEFMIGSSTRPINTLILTGASGNTCTLDVTVASPSCSSDERLKTNISDLSGTLDQLLQVRTVQYNWINFPDKGNQIGFLAQDLEQYFPEVVSDAPNGFKTVSYGGMTPILVEAIRELNLKVTNLSLMTVGSPDTVTLKNSLRTWFADRANGITEFFAKKIHTDELCVGSVCVTESQFLQMVQQTGTTVQIQPNQDPTPVVSDDDATSPDDVPVNDEPTTDEPVSSDPGSENITS